MPAIDLDDPSKSAGDKSMFAKIYENLKNDTEIKEILDNYDNKAKAKTKDIFNNENGIKNVLKTYFEINNIDYEYNGSDGITPKINIVNRYGDKTSENLSHAGSGIRKIIKFIARTKFDGQQKSIFLIDEPEQNLHPKFQNLLIDFLKDAEIQCIFTSHSPTFVKHCMNSENCEVSICKRDENSKIMVKPIKEHIKEKGYKFLENYTNSQAVANFLAFGEYSTDLFIYIYEILKQKAEDKYNKMNDTEKNEIEVDNGINKDCKVCLKNARVNKIMESFFLKPEQFKTIKKQRNDLAHNNKLISDDDIRPSIDDMIKVLRSVEV